MSSILPMTRLAPSVSKNMVGLEGRGNMATTVLYVCHLGQVSLGQTVRAIAVYK